MVDWKSLYFVELLWISEMYVCIALLITYGSYLCINAKVDEAYPKNQIEEEEKQVQLIN